MLDNAVYSLCAMFDLMDRPEFVKLVSQNSLTNCQRPVVSSVYVLTPVTAVNSLNIFYKLGQNVVAIL